MKGICTKSTYIKTIYIKSTYNRIVCNKSACYIRDTYDENNFVDITIENNNGTVKHLGIYL